MTMVKRKVIRWAIITVGVLVLIPVVYFGLILDWQGRPFCHKQILLGLLTWSDEAHTKAFPNVRGLSWDSILAFQEEMAGTNWARHYKYVPGLHQDDPGDLVMLYFDQPTRWIWHGAPSTVFRKKAWILVRVDFTGPGECSEEVSTPEFERRLQRTLDFIRTNERPNWQTVIAEHEKFLKELEHRHD